MTLSDYTGHMDKTYKSTKDSGPLAIWETELLGYPEGIATLVVHHVDTVRKEDKIRRFGGIQFDSASFVNNILTVEDKDGNIIHIPGVDYFTFDM